MLRLPESYKRQGRLNRDAIERNWPELLRFDFNKGGARFEFNEVPYQISSFGRRLGHRFRRVLRC
jgi:hypothetical protein